MIRQPPRSTLSSSSAASDVYKRQVSRFAVFRIQNCVTCQLRVRLSINGSGTFALQNDHFRTARGNGYLRCQRFARLTSLIGRGHTRSNRVCPRPIRRTAARPQAAACTPLGRAAWRCSTRRTAASMPVPAAGAASGLAVLSLHNRAQPRPPTHWRRVNSMIWSCCSPVSWSLTGRWIIHLHTA